MADRKTTGGAARERSSTKKKVVILGGGCASMTAAYYLSHTQELRDQLDVTVYQMGWRLGGKGASGRDRSRHNRILEHGLHVWGGFYYNAFRMIREAYDALDRPPECALRTWTDAYKPHPLVVVEEYLGNKWEHWPLDVPKNKQTPGHGRNIPTLRSFSEMALGWLRDFLFEFPHDDIRKSARSKDRRESWLSREFHKIESKVANVFDGSAVSLVDAAIHLASRLESDEGPVEPDHHDTFIATVSEIHGWLRAFRSDHRGDVGRQLRRLYILIDIFLAMHKGIRRDGVVFRGPEMVGGFETLDEYDFAEWLESNGADEVALRSALIRGWYDYFFAYEDGDTGDPGDPHDNGKPRLSAAMGLNHLLRLIGEYHGCLFYKMQSGMGDVVFGPLYEMCERNGVHFEFFHEVDHLEVAPDGKSIAKVHVNRQVNVPNGPYRALFDAQGKEKTLPSWPSEPLWNQLDPKQVAELKRRHADLEDPWTDWDPAERIVLEAGEHYDAVVLGISIGGFTTVCRELLEQRQDWHDMVKHLPAIQTIALQLWWKPDMVGLGWDMGNATLTSYGQPLESYSDMSGVIDRENWPEGDRPQSIAYFCGPMKTPSMPNAGKHPAFGEEQKRLADEWSRRWTESFIAHLFPKAADPSDPSRIRRGFVLDRYFRANYSPSERYVIDLPGTSKYRFEADTSGYTNLVLAGDWLFTGLGGAVESAVVTGMQAARTLTGEPLEIMGELESPWRRERSVQPIV